MGRVIPLAWVGVLGGAAILAFAITATPASAQAASVMLVPTEWAALAEVWDIREGRLNLAVP